MLFLVTACSEEESTSSNYKLTVTSENGNVVKSPDQDSYKEGAKVKLEATPDNGYQFKWWMGSGLDEVNTTLYTVTVRGDMNIEAIFEEENDEESNEEFSYESSISTVRSNNSALLTAEDFTIGDGSIDHSQLRKEVAVTLLNPNDNFSLGKGYITRSRTNSEYGYLIIPVTNESSNDFSFIELVNIKYKDSDGQVLATDEYSYMNGSVGDLLSSITTDTCLFAGETGYLLTLEGDVFSEVTEIEIEKIEVADFTVKQPQPSIIPQGFKYSNSQKYNYLNELTFNLKNEGTETGDFSMEGAYILLDNNSVPLYWNFIHGESNPTNELLEVESTGSISDDGINYDFSASKLIVFINFKDVTYTQNLFRVNSIMQQEKSSSTPEQLLELRNRREEEKYQRILEMRE